jgi:C4-dicarboxylate-specific signal transduction histidine kinase
MSVELASVLYVDDEPINLRVFDANFRARFKVLTCTSGQKALEIIAGRGAEIGILLSDQRMPEMTGVELLEKVKAQAPDIQRMIITAYSDMQAVMDAVNRGEVSRYFVKPWVREELGAVLEDVLRIHGLRLRLRELERRMAHSERLAAIGQISAGIAHELMNPVSYMSQNIVSLRRELATLSKFITPLLEAHPSKEVTDTLSELPSLLADVETGAKHIRQVALGLKAQARGDDENSTSDIADVAGFAVKLAASEVRSLARLRVSGDPLQVRGGQVKLTQVLLNLIVNAAHAMQGTGRPGLIEISWAERDGKVVVSVRDNGCGIPEALREKVFEPLFTTKPVGVGTGLGLAICRDLMRGMGGDITLDSEEGAGTTVELVLLKP